MKKILLIDDSDTYTWCLQKYLQHRGYPVKTACTLKEARAAIQEEMPLVVCCDLDLPDGSGMDFLDEVRAADKCKKNSTANEHYNVENTNHNSCDSFV